MNTNENAKNNLIRVSFVLIRGRSEIFLHRLVLTADGFVGFLEGFLVLDRAAVHVVSDVHQFLAGGSQAGLFHRLFVGLGAEPEDLVEPVVVHVLAD